jgi:hypothetical protein
MDTSTWQLMPWFSLLIFAFLVRLTGGSSYRTINPYTGTEVQHKSDGIPALLIVSLIVGASLCVLIEYFFA